MNDECNGKAKLIPRPLSSVDTGGLNMEKGWPEVKAYHQKFVEADARASQRENMVGGWTLPPLPPPPELPKSQVGDLTAQSENTD